MPRRFLNPCWLGDSGHGGLALAKLADGLNQLCRIAQRFSGLQLLKQLREPVMALLQEQRQCLGVVIATIYQPFIEAFQFMGKIANRLDLRHPRTALERVQIALQREQRCGVFRIAQPALQGLASAFEDVHRLFEKDRDDLLVHIGWRCALFELRRGITQLANAQATAAITANEAHGRGIEAFVEQFAQGSDPRRRRADFLASGQFVEHVDQCFMGALRLVEKPFADRQAAFFHRAIQVEQGFAELVHRVQIGQVRTFPKGSELIEQRTEFLAFAGMLLPALQQALGVQQDVHALGQEVVDQLRVAPGSQRRARSGQQGFQPLGQYCPGPLDQ
ncbi:hypothetical protein D3C73_751930 [compost metagenome]